MSEPRIKAAAAARELREYGAAFDSVRDSMVAGLVSSPPEDAIGRERTYWAVRVLDIVHDVMMSAVNAGKVEDAAQHIRDRLRVI